MSIKATLISLFLVLSAGIVWQAGLRFAGALTEMRVAEERRSAVPVVKDLYSAAALINRERLRLFGVFSSSRRLRGEALDAIKAELASTDEALQATLVRLAEFIDTADIKGAMEQHREARATLIEAARGSAMTRDLSLGRDWLLSAHLTFETWRSTANALMDSDGSIGRLKRDANLLNDAISREIALIGGLVSSRSAISPTAAAQIAGAAASYQIAIDRVGEAAVLLENEGLRFSLLDVDEVLLYTYGARRDAIVDVGVNGGEPPEFANGPDWFETGDLLLDALLGLQTALSDASAEIEGARYDAAYQALMVSAGVIIAACSVVVGGLVVLRSRVILPIQKLVKTVDALADGNLDVSLRGLPRSHEIGALVKALHLLRESSRAAKAAEEAQAAERAARRAARENAEQENQRMIAGVDRVILAAAAGEFGQSIARPDGDVDPATLALLDRVEALCDIVRGFTGDIHQAVTALSQGNLTHRVETTYEGVFGDVATGIQNTMRRVGGTVADVKRSADGIDQAADKISSGAVDLSLRTQEQAEMVEESMQTITEIAQSVRANADAAVNASEVGQRAAKAAEDGVDVVSDTATAMAKIEESSKGISEIVSLIEDIAFQTNLLALNAAVEAARAGTAGAGFAIVAQEVRSLAQRAANAANEIAELIRTSAAHVEEGANCVQATNVALDGIKDSIDHVVAEIQAIANASREQAVGTEQVAAAFGEIGSVTQRNSALASETSDLASMLEINTKEMIGTVSFFTTETDQANTESGPTAEAPAA